MNATEGNNQQPAWASKRRVNKFNALAVLNWTSILRASLLSFLALSLVFAHDPAAAADFMVPVKSIAQITIDDDNRALDFPVEVFFDPAEEEIYIINGGTNRVVVYGPDFFPHSSIGNGRGVLTPRGVVVTDNGDVYVSQVPTSVNPLPRITILNGAFFVDREIFLDQTPEAAGLRPKKLVLGQDNLIYLTGDNTRGVLVLDNEGNFLRWLRPEGEITLRGEEADKYAEEKKQPLGQDESFSVVVEEMFPEELDFSNIPEEFRPKTSAEKAAESRDVVGPVKINHVNIDSAGNLYLISPEVGKIYVYSPDESLLFSFGTKGGSPGQLSLPRSLAIDEEHEMIHVVDYMRHTILAYDMKTGEYLFEYGGRGFNPGWFNFPSSIAINNYGQIIVADLYNRRVQVLEIGIEAASYYRKELTLEPLPESSDSLESTEQNELVPGQPEGLIDPGYMPESSIEQEEETIQDFKFPAEPSAESPDALEVSEQDKLASGQPGGLNLQDKETAPPVEQPDSGIGEKKIVEEEIIQAFALPKQPQAPKALPDFDAVDAFVGSWADAWEQKNVETYVTHYSRDFSTPGGRSMAAWEKRRYRSFGRAKFIKIGIRDMQIQKVGDSRAQVTFIQEYQSDIYSDQVVKTLELIWENGDWKIIQETSKGLQESSKPEDAIPPAPTVPPGQPIPDAEGKVPGTTAVEAQAKPGERGMTAAESRDFAIVEQFIESWLSAWEQQDAITYLTHYSSNFIAPEGKSFVAWGKERLEKLTNQEYINVEIRDMQIQKVNDSRMQVTFIQEYQSETYSDKVFKTLELIWEKGEWMILQETVKAL